ncbi:hypothetical protein A7982_13805 [Minicystis rosea]|nr:hypothetical protein A7982_13805 [Minicystis rosea]
MTRRRCHRDCRRRDSPVAPFRHEAESRRAGGQEERSSVHEIGPKAIMAPVTSARSLATMDQTRCHFAAALRAQRPYRFSMGLRPGSDGWIQLASSRRNDTTPLPGARVVQTEGRDRRPGPVRFACVG